MIGECIEEEKDIDLSQAISDIKIHFTPILASEKSGDGFPVGSNQELIVPQQLLVSLNKGKVCSAITFVSDDCTEISSDGCKLLSDCYGYAKALVVNGKSEYKVSVSMVPLVSFKRNRMEVVLNLFLSESPSNYPTVDIVKQALDREGVTFGVDLQAISRSLDSLSKNKTPIEELLIARGKRPINGKDGYIRFEVEIGPLPGKLLADGSIDFRERLMFVGVQKGQLLACKVPASKGKPGCNTAGELVQATDGKDITVNVSDDTYYCEDDGTIRATESGVLTVVNEGTIRVLSKQIINSDIDYHTGNIRSQNCVEITGSVQPGFIVSVKGNVVIEGSIQSASVNSHGNIIVKGGIVGQKTKIRVQGTAELRHIENGVLSAGGNVVIRNGAYYSNIQVGGDLHCPETVKIIGGDIVVSGSLSCGQVGSTAATPISIAVGVDLSRYHLYQNLQEEYRVVLQETQELMNHNGRLKQANSVILRREKTLRSIEKELSELNLIPGTPDGSMGDKISFYTPETVTVYGNIAAGSILRIGNETMVLSCDMSNVVIKMQRASAGFAIDQL